MHHRSRFASAVSVGLLVVLGLIASRPAQAQASSPAVWLGDLVRTLTQWTPPSWWTRVDHPAAMPARVPSPAVTAKGVTTTDCYSGGTDPDGGCPH
jgi:hypothetical protein